MRLHCVIGWVNEQERGTRARERERERARGRTLPFSPPLPGEKKRKGREERGVMNVYGNQQEKKKGCGRHRTRTLLLTVRGRETRRNGDREVTVEVSNIKKREERPT